VVVRSVTASGLLASDLLYFPGNCLPFGGPFDSGRLAAGVRRLALLSQRFFCHLAGRSVTAACLLASEDLLYFPEDFFAMEWSVR